MQFIKRVCVFLIMFWTVGFLLTLVVQFFAHRLFDIDFRSIAHGETVEIAPGERLNIYIAAEGPEPDLEALQPVVEIHGSNADTLHIAPFAFRMSPPGKDEGTVFAQALYSVTASDAQQVTIAWSNPVDGYFLATSKSLLLSSVAFFSLIFLSMLGATGLYYAFGSRVLRRLSVNVPDAQIQKR